jgi:hypothetical protein
MHACMHTYIHTYVCMYGRLKDHEFPMKNISEAVMDVGEPGGGDETRSVPSMSDSGMYVCIMYVCIYVSCMYVCVCVYHVCMYVCRGQEEGMRQEVCRR